MFVNPKIKLALFLALFLLISVAGWIIARSAIFVATSTIMVAVLAYAQLRIYRQLELVARDQKRMADEQQQHYHQIQSLFSLFSMIRPSQQLPHMGVGWAIEPDFANIIVGLIREHKPTLIVEAGSGVSTIVAAYALKDVGQGTIVSLEHDEQYWTNSRKHVKRHRLENIAIVHHAPLKEVVIHGEKWLWYDTSEIAGGCPIDMMIIDGPPGHIQKCARYPALPLLFDRLNDNAVVLLHDTVRQDEQEIIEAWIREFRCFEVEAFEVGDGAAVLRARSREADTAE